MDTQPQAQTGTAELEAVSAKLKAVSADCSDLVKTFEALQVENQKLLTRLQSQFSESQSTAEQVSAPQESKTEDDAYDKLGHYFYLRKQADDMRKQADDYFEKNSVLWKLYGYIQRFWPTKPYQEDPWTPGDKLGT